MQYLSNITNNPNQTYNMYDDASNSIAMTLIYLPNQQIWMANFIWKNWILNGIILTNEMNCLKQYVNNIPFGIACVSNDLVDPFLLTDFSSGRSRLYLLNQTEITTLQTQIESPQ